MKKLFLVIAFAAFALAANAQTHFSLHLGGSMPMGDFGEFTKGGGKLALNSPSGKQGGAGMGFNVGLKLKFDISSVDGLGIILAGDFFYNGPNSDMSDMFEKMESGNTEITSPKYLNIPVTVGVNYTYALSNSVGLFGEAAVGPNFSKVTNYVMTQGENEAKQKYKLGVTFGFQVGAGFIFNDRFSIGIHYYALGTNKLKATTDTDSESGYYDYESYKYKKGVEKASKDSYYDDSDSETKLGKLSASMVVLRLGLHF